MSKVNEEETLVRAIMKDDAAKAHDALEKMLQKKCADKIMSTLNGKQN